HIWLNPLDERYWKFTQSVQMIDGIFGDRRMVPMTLDGITRGMKLLT
ncbi:VWA domain-containing protein, partial [Octadecabacter sp.]|nr:VWA domain-containing protein [Octadecabacter sp.]